MPQDERSLFGDEQAYITWKRQQEAEARDEALKAAQARKKRRRVKYSDRIQRAFQQIRYRSRMAAIRADPERYEAWKKHERERAALQYARNPERRAMYVHNYYLRNREIYRLRNAVYHDEHREEINAHQREYWHAKYAVEREDLLAQQRAYYASHREEKRAYFRAYQSMRSQDPAYCEKRNARMRARRAERGQDPLYRERINAQQRARRAAKKAAKE